MRILTGFVALGAAALLVAIAGVRSEASAAAASAATLTVSARANIFGSGRAAPPAPGGGGAGTSPVVYDLPAGTTQLTFQNGTGSVTCCSNLPNPPYNGPGGSAGSTDIDPVGSVSGVAVANLQMFLVGVFLGSDPPGGIPPPTGTATKSPALRQVFYVGAGPRTVAVPAGATRLFLGFADAFNFQGQAGYYDDNQGSVSVGVTVSTGAPVSPPAAPTRYSWSVLHRHGGVWEACDGESYVHLTSIRGQGTVRASGSRVTAAGGTVRFFAFRTSTKFGATARARSFGVKALAAGGKLQVAGSTSILTLPVTVLATGLAEADPECLADPDGSLVLRDKGPEADDSLSIVGLCGIKHGTIWDHISVRIKRA